MFGNARPLLRRRGFVVAAGPQASTAPSYATVIYAHLGTSHRAPSGRGSPRRTCQIERVASGVASCCTCPGLRLARAPGFRTPCVPHRGLAAEAPIVRKGTVIAFILGVTISRPRLCARPPTLARICPAAGLSRMACLWAIARVRPPAPQPLVSRSTRRPEWTSVWF